MSCPDIFDNESLAKFSSIVGDSWPELARCLGVECTCDNPSCGLRKWRDTYSRELIVQKLTWALTKIGESLDRRLTESLDEEELDDWLQTFAYSVDKYWQSLAKKLDFGEDEIQALDVAFDDESNQSLHMVMNWKEIYIKRNTMGELKLALWEMRRHDLLEALGEDVLDDVTIAIAAARIGSIWPVVAVYLGFDEDNIQKIANSSSDDNMRAATMLDEWRKHFAGDGQERKLARLLSTVDLSHVANEIDPSNEPSLSAEPSSHPPLVDKFVQVSKTVLESDEFKIVSGITHKALVSDCEGGFEDQCMFEMLHEAADATLGDLLEMIPYLKDGIVVFQQGKLCFYALKDAHEMWKTGELSKVETLRYAVEKITAAIVECYLTIGGRALGRFVGGALGAAVGSVIPVLGTCVGV